MEKELMHREPVDVFSPFWDFSRRFEDLWRARSEGGQMVSPAVDISESDDALLVHAELPGLTKQDVKITIEEGVLTIAGEKRFVKEENKHDYHRVERRYGTFHRSFSLPSGVDTQKAEAQFQDGVLTIKLPKSESAKPRTLEIH